MGQKVVRSKTFLDIDYFLLNFPHLKKVKIINNGLLYKTLLVNNINDNAPLILKIFPKGDYDLKIYNTMFKKMKEIKSKVEQKLIKPNSYTKFYNIVPIFLLEDKERAGIFIRQNFFFDLKERLYTLPYLTKIEKIWIIFQFFYGIYQLHEAGIYHGDLRIENILLTSNSSVFICDISPYKPAYLKIDDIGMYTCYFGNNLNDNFRSCYLAPERIVDKGEFNSNIEYELTPAMDIFSAGIVFAELMLEENLLDYSKISNYKKNNLIIESILKKIHEKNIRSLIRKMTVVNPKDRINIREVLQIMISDICPISMTQMLIHMNNLITTTVYWKPDIIIGLIYKHWRQIWKMTFGLEEKPPVLYQKLNYSIINKLTLNNLFIDIKDDIRKNEEAEKLKIELEKKQQKFKEEIERKKLEKYMKNKENHRLSLLEMIVVKEKNENDVNELEEKNTNSKKDEDKISKTSVIVNGVQENGIDINNKDNDEENIEIKKEKYEEIIFDLIINNDDLSKLKNETLLDPSIFNKNNNQDTIKIFMDYILQNIDSVKYDSSNLVGMEMLKHMSFKFSDYEKLDIIIPYFIENLYRENILNKITTIQYLFDVLYSINYRNLILPVISYKYFDKYIFPVFLELFESKNKMILLSFINSINKLIDLEQKFLNVVLRTKLQRLNKEKNIEGNDYIKLLKQNNSFSIYKPSINSFMSPMYEKREKIFKDYDNSLKEFKDKLFECVLDLISNSEEIDIIIALIKQLPDLLIFYGKGKKDDFIKFIINNTNKNQWAQREILKYIPRMTATFGEGPLNGYIIPCLEMLISNNSNEFKILELINTILSLFRMDYLSKESSIDLYIKLLPFSVHPNIRIRNEIKEFSKELLSKMNDTEIYYYLFNSMKNYLYSSGFDINYNIINEYLKERLSRIVYDFELYNYNYRQTSIKQCDINSKTLLFELISTIKRNTFDSGKPIYSFNKDFLIKFVNINKSEPRTFNEIIPNEYKKFCSKNKNEENANILSFVCKLMWLGDLSSPCLIPNIKTNEDNIFEFNNDMLTSSQNFKISFLYKTLGVNFKLITLNDFLNIENKDSTTYKHQIENFRTIRNNFKKSQFGKWRPQGQLLSTLYNHKRKSVEKLVPIDNNQFASIDDEGEIILWNIIDDNGEIIVKKSFSFNEKNKFNLKIIYNKTIRIVDNMSFIFACNEELYELNPPLKTTSDFLVKLYEKEKNPKDNCNNITCCIGIGKNVQESQKIVFSQENGYLNVLDKRIQKVALKTYIPIEKGIISCFYKSSNIGLYIGTLGGYILNYDMRINSICSSYKYCSNKPIIGISTFNSRHGYGFPNKYPNMKKYLMIWTGADDHELGLWNQDNFNCDILFKVNKTYSNELEPITVEIPDLIEEENEFLYDNESKLFNYELQRNFYQLKYLDNIIYKKTKGIVLPNIKHEFYLNIPKRLKNLSNLYETQSTVQQAFTTMNINSENFPYIISAGNDMTIRYWSIIDENNNNNKEKNQEQFSYLINAPENISKCTFSKSIFCDTIIVQSNEFFNLNEPKKSVIGFSEYQNYNGITFHTSLQNEFNEEDKSQFKTLNYCTRISDCSHKNIITDIIPMPLDHEFDDGLDKFQNLLISSSWDGTVKIWK